MDKELIKELIFVKKAYKNLLKRIVTSSPALRNKYSLDLATVRGQFIHHVINLDVTPVADRLCLFAPQAGPWNLMGAENFKQESFWYVSFNFKDDPVRYVGEYDLLDDKCGYDNLEVIARFLGLEYNME